MLRRHEVAGNVYQLSHGIEAAVARRSRAVGSQLLVVASLGSWSLEASAAPAEERSATAPTVAARPRTVSSGALSSEAVPADAGATREGETYGLTLGLAYLLAPALAVAAGAGTFEVTESDAVAVVAGGLMFTLPAAVHVYHGAPDQALESLGWMLGATLGGAAVLGGLGYVLGVASCDKEDPYYEAEGCDMPTWGMTLVGGATGAIIGYVSYGVYDLLENASVPAAEQTDTRGQQALRLWLNPVMSAHQERRRSADITGLTLGAALQF